MRVVHVTDDIANKALTLPTSSLPPMNGDIDGDIIDVYRIIGEYFAKEFGKTLNPRYNLYINRIDGRINKELVPFKDESAAFYQFNNI